MRSQTNNPTETATRKLAEDAPLAGGALQYVASVAFWVVLWGIAAFAINNQIVLAGPAETLQALAQLFVSQSFWLAVGISAARIIASALVSALVGIAFGALAARWRIVRLLLTPPVQVLKSAPVACIAVLFLVVVGSVGTIPVIVAMVALPPFYVATLQAHQEVRAPEQQRTRSALALMGARPRTVFFACTWPVYLAHYSTSAKTAIGLSWRAGITAELLGVPLGSIGSAIYAAKITLDTPALLAWVVCIMLLSVLCEWAVCTLLSWLGSPARVRWMTGVATGDEPAFEPASVKDRACEFASAEEPSRGSLGEGPSADDQQFAREVPPAAGSLSVTDISLSYDGKQILDQVSLTLAPGERVCLMAPTGSGKTTFLNVLLRQVVPDGGTVQVPERIGVVMQMPALVPDLTALQNVMLVVRDEVEARQALNHLLPVGCTDKRAAELSGGTKRLTEIVRALLSASGAIVLDEPFAGLDDHARKQACAFIVARLNGRPLLVATHNKEDATLLDASIFEL